MIQRNIIPVLNSILGDPFYRSPLIASYHRGDNLITWALGRTPDGRLLHSRTWLGSLDEPERAEGQSLDYAYLDELRLVRYVALSLKVIQRRLRGSANTINLGYPIGAWITTTPDDPGSDLHGFTENPETRNPNCKVYRMTLFDNEENLPPGYIAEIERAHIGGEYDRFVLGLFATVSSGILRFDYAVHVVHDFETSDGEIWLVDEQEEPIQALSSLRSWSYGHDFGWTDPAVQLAIGWDGDHRCYVLDELYGSRLTEEALIENALEFEQLYGRGDWHCDPSEPRTIEKLSAAGLWAFGYKGKRDDGHRELGSRFQLQGDGRYRLYVHRRCVNLISELQTYNPDEKTRDHAVDGVRYGVMGGPGPSGDIQIEFGKRPR
jgi:hypothetical protein